VLFVIDIGNTNIVIGLYEGERLSCHWRVSTGPQRTADEYAMVLRSLFRYAGTGFDAVTAIAVSSVVPPLTPAIVEMCRAYFGLEPLVVGPDTDTGLCIKYENPQDVGADRIVNSVAAYAKYGGPLVVVDLGTATTFDVISADGCYLGGAIAPGIGISAEALFQRAARLSRIELVRPKTAIGTNTAASMQSGIIFGFAGQVDALVRRISAELGGLPRVIATGGLAELICSDCSTIEAVDPFLTLEGLRLIYCRNQAAGRRE
jgi:type III pantothenate kinase